MPMNRNEIDIKFHEAEKANGTESTQRSFPTPAT